MNYKTMAAIALTLIVAVPIGMGYLLNISDEDVSTIERGEGRSVSDELLNSTAYFSEKYVNVRNNNQVANIGDIWGRPLYVTTTLADTGYPTGLLGGGYGVINDGWTFPDGYVAWSNGRTNEHVFFTVDLGTAQGVLLKASPGKIVDLGTEDTNDMLTITRTASGLDLDYVGYTGHAFMTNHVADSRYVQLEFSASESVVVTLLTYRPAYGEEYIPTGPTTAIQWGDSPDVPQYSISNRYISMYSADPTVNFRCEYATTTVGGYPVTSNYAVKVPEFFPDAVGVDFVINGADRYGPQLRISGLPDFEVSNDGTITVDGKAVRLKGAVIRFEELGTPDHYKVTINGKTIVNDTTDARVRFVGQWLVSASAYSLKESTETVHVWHAGEFGLDKTGIAAVGLLVCGGLLVGLGMTGPRSGVKIGALLLICGGAALVYLILI